ncbi:hypothetical protein MTYP_00724 [Methylophilaceae bacterium]|nr:hypothetical protein MTYP_00724 [Methylophilaceae bacterium]
MRYPLKTASRWLGVALLLLALSACSAVRLSYNNAQEIMYWWLNSYVHFTAAQKPAIREELHTLHTWHRFQEIPVYIQLLELMQSMAGSDIKSEQACNVIEDIRHRYRVMSMQFEPIIERLAPTLEPEQIDHIKKHFEKNNRKWREEWLDGAQAERNERRVKQTIKRAEKFYGRLSPQQREIIRDNIQHSAFNPETSYAHRLQLQEDALLRLNRIVRQNLADADIKLEIAAYFDQFHGGEDTAYKIYLDKMTHDACESFARLHNATSTEQRQKAAEKLGNYLADLRALKSSAQITE